MKKIYLELVNEKMKNGRLVFRKNDKDYRLKQCKSDLEEILFRESTYQAFKAGESFDLIKSLVYSYYNRFIDYVSDMMNFYDDSTIQLNEKNAIRLCEYFNHFFNHTYNIVVEVVEDKKRTENLKGNYRARPKRDGLG